MDVRGCKSIPGLGQFTKLTELDISRCLEIRELLGAEHFISLDKLVVGGCKKLDSIPRLGQLTEMFMDTVRCKSFQVWNI